MYAVLFSVHVACILSIKYIHGLLCYNGMKRGVCNQLSIDLRENLLIPWSRVLLEKLTGSAASQEIPRIFGTRRFLTVLTSARHLSLS